MAGEGEGEGDSEDEGSDGEDETARMRTPGQGREHDSTMCNIVHCAVMPLS